VEEAAAVSRTRGERLGAWTRRHWHQLVAVVVAAALRLPTVLNGLPYVRHPDEPVNYLVIHHMVTAPTLKPGFYDYPSLQYEIQAVVHSALGNVGVWMGWWHSFSDLALAPRRGLGTTLALRSAPWVAGRMVTLTIACLGIWVVAGLACRLCRSQRWGAFGGLIAAVSGIGIATGAVITPDALAGTTAIISIALLVELVDRHDDTQPERPPSRRWVALTGISLGLAVGSKYNNGALVAALAIAVWCTPAVQRPTRRQLAALCGIAVGAFVASTPAVIIDLAAFAKGIHHLVTHYSAGHDFAGGPWYTDARFLAASDGVAVVLATAAVLFRRTRTTMLLAGWVVAYLLVLSLTEVHFDRNLTPILGTVAVLAAVGAQQLWHVLHSFATQREQRRVTLLPAAVAAVLVAATLPIGVVHARVTAHNLRHQLTDYQSLSRVWLEQQIVEGSKVVTDWYSPWLDRTRWYVVPVKLSKIDGDAQLAHATALVVASTGSGLYLEQPAAYPDSTATMIRLRSMACATQRFDDGWGYWVEIWYLRCPPPGASTVLP
jgi:4-amino-4-deoxy-L-arabinose transferase-like glycosyltransferase